MDLFAADPPNPFVERVRIRNYKSVGACDVRLGALTFLVGQNGSGKSNFIDALHFVRESLESTVEHALDRRGGIKDVRRLSTGHPTHFSMRFDLRLEASRSASYAFRVGSRKDAGFEIQHEKCIVIDDASKEKSEYETKNGRVLKTTLPAKPAYAADRLYLVALSGFPEFRPVYDALTSMTFYNPNPTRIRELSPADAGEQLRSDGENLASVFGRFENSQRARVLDFLSKIVPDIEDVQRKGIAGNDALEFSQTVKGAQHPWKFYANSMSDGTLRALGILVALFQAQGKSGRPLRLVALEEPEAALHPAATGVLLDALLSAAELRQVLVTSHSPDLLDSSDIKDSMLLSVAKRKGTTIIAGVDNASRKALQEHLYTAGELLRLDQLEPDSTAVSVDSSDAQLGLFAD